MGKTSGAAGGAIHHPVPYLFLKLPVRQNVLIGDDPLQIRFVEQLLKCECVTIDSLTDDDILGVEDVLFRVRFEKSLELTPAVRSKIGMWSLQPVAPDSASANALVRVASKIIGEPLDEVRFNAIVKEIGRRFKKNFVRDLRVGLWETCDLILEGNTPTNKWKEPWDTADPMEWLPPGTNIDMRLGTLFKHLRAYVYLLSGVDEEAMDLKVLPSKIKYLQGLHLDPEKVYETLKALSRHRYFGADPRKVVLALVKIWAR
jgi:hypothetical protein